VKSLAIVTKPSALRGAASTGTGGRGPSSGKQLGTFTESSAWQDGYIQNNLRVPQGPETLTVTNPGTVTVTDNLGGTATIPVTVNTKYS
jgi:hypothetical protein